MKFGMMVDHVFDQFFPDVSLKKRPVFDGFVDQPGPLGKNPAASDGVMADFAVAHICIRGHAHCGAVRLEFCAQGILLKPILTEFNWTRAIVSGAMSTSAGIAGLLGVVAGRLTDKYGPRILMGVGALLGILGYLLMNWMDSIWQLYIYFGVIVGISFAVCWTPINATVSRWFFKKRVLALGITTSGITLGHMFVPPLVALFIDANDWRFAYIMLALLVLISVIPALLMLGRNPPLDIYVLQRNGNSSNSIDAMVVEQPEPYKWTILEAAKTLPFQMLMVTGFVTAAGFYFIAVHIVAYATDLGIDATLAALILTFMGGANILGKLLMPPIVTKIGGRFSLLLLFALQAITLFSLS